MISGTQETSQEKTVVAYMDQRTRPSRVASSKARASARTRARLGHGGGGRAIRPDARGPRLTGQQL